MNYEDYPILSDFEYEIINKNYAHKTPTRKQLLSNIFKNLNLLILDCINCNIENKKIFSAVKQTKQRLETISENLDSIFEFEKNNQTSIRDFNIFKFLENLCELQKLFYSWHQTEEKEYYKTICSNNFFLLFDCSLEILSTLSDSYIKIFKYM